MNAIRPKRPPEVIGWRELISLPDFAVPSMKVKIDTGARTSALHGEEQEEFERDGQLWVRFVLPISNHRHGPICEAPLIGQRDIKNTSGVPERRHVISTLVLLGRHKWHIECSLADRAQMGFDMILGRTAIRRRRILVDPAHSFLAGPPKARLKDRVAPGEHA